MTLEQRDPCDSSFPNLGYILQRWQIRLLLIVIAAYRSTGIISCPHAWDGLRRCQRQGRGWGSQTLSGKWLSVKSTKIKCEREKMKERSLGICCGCPEDWETERGGQSWGYNLCFIPLLPNCGACWSDKNPQLTTWCHVEVSFLVLYIVSFEVCLKEMWINAFVGYYTMI